MKNSIVLLILVLFSTIIYLVSCNKESRTTDFDHTSSHFVSINEAENEVLSLAQTIDSPTRSKGSRRISSRQTVINAKTRSTTETSPIYYVFQFEDNAGFALASADRRTAPVFCITDSGEFPGFSSTDNPGFRLALDAIDQYYRILTGLPIYDDNGELVEANDAKVLFRLDPPDDTCEYYYPDPGTCIQLWQIESRNGAILPTRWGQGAPFNHYCFTADSLNALVGCAAVAVGQIMYSHQLDYSYNGTYYSWDYMASILRSNSDSTNYIGWNLVQHLLADLGRPENLDMEYGLNGSSAFYDNVPRTFNNFGYTHSGTLTDFDALSIKSWVSAGPLYGRGAMSGVGGHAWVFDEVITRVRKVFQGSTPNSPYTIEHDELVHINWGWYGEADGYYVPGVFNVMAGPVNPRDDSHPFVGMPPYYFNSYLKVYHSISPD